MFIVALVALFFTQKTITGKQNFDVLCIMKRWAEVFKMFSLISVFEAKLSWLVAAIMKYRIQQTSLF
jgi:hypothetical protein